MFKETVVFLLLASIFAFHTLAASPQQANLGFSAEQHLASCTIKLPTSYQQVVQDTPDTSYPQSRVFNVSQKVGGGSDVDTLLRFASIPSGSYGCELTISFTFDYPITTSGNAQLNVYTLPNAITADDTYSTYFSEGSNSPKNAYLFGTIRIDGQRAVINSQICKPDMGYLFKIASETAEGKTVFVDAGNSLNGIGGFYMAYNC